MRDGHTHTGYCRHGSSEPTEAFVRRAIELGFTTYSVTEHPPLPSSFKRELKYPSDVIETICMADDQVDAYVRDMLRLKEKFRDRIDLRVGFEVDYLPGEEGWTRRFLQAYGKWMDDGLVSVHFMRGRDGYYMVDSSAQDVREHLMEGGDRTFADFCAEYYTLAEQAVVADLGPYGPRRLGHLDLCYKFVKVLEESRPAHAGSGSRASGALTTDHPGVRGVLQAIKDNRYALDYNVAGLFKPDCGRTYVSQATVRECARAGIDLVYGSDAHAVQDVGRAYDAYRQATTGV
jgi:histidinol-phosphatase (PHP family)